MAFWDDWETDIGGRTFNPIDVAGSVLGLEDIVGGLQTGDYGRAALGAAGFIPGVGVIGRGLGLAARGARAANAARAVTTASRYGSAGTRLPRLAAPATTASRTARAATPARSIPVAGRARAAASSARSTAKQLNAPLIPAKAVTRLQKSKLGRFAAASTKPSALYGGYVLSKLSPVAENYLDRAMAQPGAGVFGGPRFVIGSGGYGPTGESTVTGGQGGSGTGGGGAGGQGGGQRGKGGRGGSGGGGTGPSGGQGGSGTPSGQPSGQGGGGGSEDLAPPVDVQLAEADYNAALARAAAAAQSNEAMLRDLFSQQVIGAQSTAADVYGGRSRAILGQGLTGARRRYVSGMTQEQARAVQERADIKAANDEAIRRAYQRAAEIAQQRAAERAALATQIMGVGA